MLWFPHHRLCCHGVTYVRFQYSNSQHHIITSHGKVSMICLTYGFFKLSCANVYGKSQCPIMAQWPWTWLGPRTLCLQIIMPPPSWNLPSCIGRTMGHDHIWQLWPYLECIVWLLQKRVTVKPSILSHTFWKKIFELHLYTV